MNMRYAPLGLALLLLAGCSHALDPVSVRNTTLDRGQAAMAANKHTAAPTIQITSPVPSILLPPIVPPTVNVTWAASDSDGPHDLPREIRYLLLDRAVDGDLITSILVRPDTLLGLYAPTFGSWTQLSGKATGVTLSGLTPNDQYLLIVTAIDRQGHYDGLFSLSKNMLFMNVARAGQRSVSR